jgi:hypothetical protein
MEISKLFTDPAISRLIGALVGGGLSYLGAVSQVRAEHAAKKMSAIEEMPSILLRPTHARKPFCVFGGCGGRGSGEIPKAPRTSY